MTPPNSNSSFKYRYLYKLTSSMDQFKQCADQITHSKVLDFDGKIKLIDDMIRFLYNAKSSLLFYKNMEPKNDDPK